MKLKGQSNNMKKKKQLDKSFESLVPRTQKELSENTADRMINSSVKIRFRL